MEIERSKSISSPNSSHLRNREELLKMEIERDMRLWQLIERLYGKQRRTPKNGD